MNIDEAKVFVEKNSRQLNDENRLARCVDGRYENIPNMPLISKPGADAGDLMVAFGALNILQTDLPKEDVMMSVLEVIGGVKNFRFHTDSHADSSTPGIGCGHIKQAKTDPQSYGLKQQQIDFIFDQLPKLLGHGAVQEVLQGEHAEQAVIVVDSEINGVEPLWRDGENIREAFIYQKTLHSEQLQKLTKILQQKLAATGQVFEEQIISKAIDEAFGKQLTETLNRLANGLPVYTAEINEVGEVVITA